MKGLGIIPLRGFWSGYSRKLLGDDAVAAVNVALLAFPQGLAYALIAGLPLSHGVFGSALAAILGALLSRSPYVILGPTNATAVLLMSGFVSVGIVGETALLVPVVLLLAGLILVAVAVFNLTTFIRYVSVSVITGYVTAGALMIIANQLKGILGINFQEHEGNSSFFWILSYLWAHRTEVDMDTVGLSVATVVIYLLLRRYARILPAVAVTLVAGSSLAVVLQKMGVGSFEFLSAVASSDFGWRVPDISLPLVSSLIGLAAALALLCLLEGVSIGSALAARRGERLDKRQEIFSMGFTNIALAFFPAMPASGSLTRSSLNVDSGAHTPLASLFTGSLLLGAAFGLGPMVAYTPKAVLSALVVMIGVSLIKPGTIRVMLKATRSDRATFLVTVVVALLVGLDVAIYAGTALSILLFLQKASRPELLEYQIEQGGGLAERHSREGGRSEVSIIHVEGDLFFGAADLLQEQMRRVGEDPSLRVVILRMRNARFLDATSVLALQELAEFLRLRERHLVICGVRPDAWRVIDGAGALEVIGRENVFPEFPENATLSTAKAIRRAKDLLGGEEAVVSLFAKSPVSREPKQ